MPIPNSVLKPGLQRPIPPPTEADPAYQWVTNMMDPAKAATDKLEPSDSLARDQAWLADKVVGRPSPGAFTVEQLEQGGFVGIYVRRPTKS